MNYTVIQPPPTTVERPFPKLMLHKDKNIILATSMEDNKFINGFIIASTYLELGSTIYDKPVNLIDFDGEVILKNS